MRKIIILLLCCGVLVSMVGCGGNTAPPPTESPPTTVSETIKTETPVEITPPITAVEPTEKEKEPVSTESADQATEPTVTATEPTTTAKPKEEIKPTTTQKPTESSAAGTPTENGCITIVETDEPPKKENHNPAQTECRFGGTEGRGIYKSVPHRARRRHRNGHPRTDRILQLPMHTVKNKLCTRHHRPTSSRRSSTVRRIC